LASSRVARSCGSLALCLVLACFSASRSSPNPGLSSEEGDSGSSSSGSSGGATGSSSGGVLGGSSGSSEIGDSGGVADAGAATLTSLTSITLPAGFLISPGALAGNATTGKAYVANNVINDAGMRVGTLDVIDAVAGTITATIPIPNTQDVTCVGVDESKNVIYVSGGDNFVAIIDGATNAVTATVPGIGGMYLAVDPSTHNVYVYNALGKVVVIDGSTQLPQTISFGGYDTGELGSTNGGLAVDPTSHTVWALGDSAVDGGVGALLTTIDGSSRTVKSQTGYAGTAKYLRASTASPGQVYVVTQSPQTVVLDAPTVYPQKSGDVVGVMEDDPCGGGAMALISAVSSLAVAQAYGPSGFLLGSSTALTGWSAGSNAAAVAVFGQLQLVLIAETFGGSTSLSATLERFSGCP
jgi:YVTN family beta-propeller protein